MSLRQAIAELLFLAHPQRLSIIYCGDSEQVRTHTTIVSKLSRHMIGPRRTAFCDQIPHFQLMKAAY